MDLVDQYGKPFPKTQAKPRNFDAATADDYRPVRGNGSSADAVMQHAGTTLRNTARYLDENHDLAVSVLDDIVNNTVGDGISISPMVRTTAGALAVDANRMLRELWEEVSDQADVTGQMGWLDCERLGARTQYRDGEVFTQIVTANGYRYPTRVPFAIEMLEPDFCPLDYFDAANNISHGIQLNAWRRPLAYYFYKNHPGDAGIFRSLQLSRDLKTVPAERILHGRFTRRLGQLRGVTIFHAALNRMRDVKDYEESERIAAKVASDMTGFIQRTGEFQGATDPSKRQLRMAAGAIFELMPGESVGTIDHNRPNTGLVDFRNAMLRAIAGGTGTRYSSISRNYDGTYSAQRQELVEGVVAYRALFKSRVRSFYAPIWTAFVEAAYMSGALNKLPRGLDLSTLYRADYRAPAIPWIDPQKEANAWKLLLEARLESHAEIMRQRGRDPAKVMEEIGQETENGLFASAITNTPTQPVSDGDETNDDDEGAGDEPRARARA